MSLRGMKDLVSVKESNHPRYTHRVWYPGADGKRLNKFFTNETEALEFAADQRKELGEVGTSFGSMNAKERSALEFWRAFVKKADPAPPPLLDVLRDAKAAWLASKASEKVADAVDKFLEHQKADGASERHLATLRSRLGRFVKQHGNSLVSSITAGTFQDWLNSLRATRADLEGSKLTATTRRNLTRSLRTFFGYAEGRGWTLKNPIPAATRSKNKSVKIAMHRAPAVLLPADVARFLKAVKKEVPALLPFWCVKFFAGIRDGEAAQLDWNMIDLEARRIDLPAEVSKTGERRSVKIEPNLAAWLKPAAKKSGPICPGDTARKRGFKKIIASLALRDAAGEVIQPFVFPSNAARHSFGTFHLFHFRNAGETALQMGHKSNPAMLHEHYKNPAAEKHAAEFWKITPPKPRGKRPSNVVPLHRKAAPAKARVS